MPQSVPHKISRQQARDIWITAQKFDGFDAKSDSTTAAQTVANTIEHLGYVQIDTINVIERCHHHILFNRIKNYHQRDLQAAQAHEKSIFEFWTHALAYLPLSAYSHFVGDMKQFRAQKTGAWGQTCSPHLLRKTFNRVRDHGPLSMSDIVEERAADSGGWGNQKPSKKAFEILFYQGKFAIARREGVKRFYELSERHFAWDNPPKESSNTARADYEIKRAIRAHALIELNNTCYLRPKRKPAIAKRLQTWVNQKRLIPIQVEGDTKNTYYLTPKSMDQLTQSDAKDGPESDPKAHILSPFDPLLIQRKRTEILLDHAHVFEAYVPQSKRKWGYFTLPVLHRGKIVAGLDLKANRKTQKLEILNWIDFDTKSDHKKTIEEALDGFHNFQFQK